MAGAAAQVEDDVADAAGSAAASADRAANRAGSKGSSRVHFERGNGARKRDPFAWLKNAEKGSPPVLFSELGQEAKGLLTKEFSAGQTASVSMITPVGILLSTIAMKLDDLIMGLVTATIVPKPGVTLELAGGSTGSVQANLKWQDVRPGLSAELSGTVPLAKSGKAAVKFRNQHCTFQAVAGLHPKPPVEVSATVGGFKGDVTLGAEAAYDSEMEQLVKATAGAGITQQGVSAAVFYDLKTREALDLVLSQAVDPNLSLAIQYTKSFDKDSDYLTYGASYKVDPSTGLKVKVNSKGTAAAAFTREFRPNSTISVTTEYDMKQLETKEKMTPPKIGISLSIML